jgi:hypothetical protein
VLAQAGCPPARVDVLAQVGGAAAQVGCLPALVDGVLAGTAKIGEIDIHFSKLTEHLFAPRASGRLAHFWHTLVKTGTFAPVLSGL